MKSLTFRIFIVMLVLTANIAACKHVAYEQSKLENNCPYEGYECPNAQAAIAEYSERLNKQAESIATYQEEAEAYRERITQLETEVAGYELQNHSRLTRSN